MMTIIRLTVCAVTLSALTGAPVLAQRFAPNAKVDAIFKPWDKPDAPGCAVGVLRNGAFAYQRGYGIANLDYDIPNDPDLVYYVGSDSKQFTAASVALLSLDGRISLDDDIRKYFPEMPDYGTPITVRHLIHHTSGIRDIYDVMSIAGLRMEDVFPDSDATALIARQKALNFKPGDAYLYSNSGYFLLAQLVRRVTGKSLREYADEKIFAPLRMTHTHFHDDPGHVMKQRAMSYESDGHGGYRISYLQNFDKVGAGGLYTNLDDLRKWDENFYTHQVGGEAMQQLIHTRGVLNNGDTLAYAFGNNVGRYRGLRTTEHGGALMGYKAEVLRFPDEHFTVLATCNLGSINPGPLAQAVAEVYLGDKMAADDRRPAPPVAPSLPAVPADADYSALAGEYYSEDADVTYVVVWSGGKLTFHARRIPQRQLAPIGKDAFRAGPLTFRFERSAPGASASGFTVDVARARAMQFQRK